MILCDNPLKAASIMKPHNKNREMILIFFIETKQFIKTDNNQQLNYRKIKQQQKKGHINSSSRLSDCEDTGQQQ